MGAMDASQEVKVRPTYEVTYGEKGESPSHLWPRWTVGTLTFKDFTRPPFESLHVVPESPLPQEEVAAYLHLVGETLVELEEALQPWDHLLPRHTFGGEVTIRAIPSQGETEVTPLEVVLSIILNAPIWGGEMPPFFMKDLLSKYIPKYEALLRGEVEEGFNYMTPLYTHLTVAEATSYYHNSCFTDYYLFTSREAVEAQKKAYALAWSPLEGSMRGETREEQQAALETRYFRDNWRAYLPWCDPRVRERILSLPSYEFDELNHIWYESSLAWPGEAEVFLSALEDWLPARPASLNLRGLLDLSQDDYFMLENNVRSRLKDLKDPLFHRLLASMDDEDPEEKYYLFTTLLESFTSPVYALHFCRRLEKVLGMQGLSGLLEGARLKLANGHFCSFSPQQWEELTSLLEGEGPLPYEWVFASLDMRPQEEDR